MIDILRTESDLEKPNYPTYREDNELKGDFEFTIHGTQEKGLEVLESVKLDKKDKTIEQLIAFAMQTFAPLLLELGSIAAYVTKQKADEYLENQKYRKEKNKLSIEIENMKKELETLHETSRTKRKKEK